MFTAQTARRVKTPYFVSRGFRGTKLREPYNHWCVQPSFFTIERVQVSVMNMHNILSRLNSMGNM